MKALNEDPDAMNGALVRIRFSTNLGSIEESESLKPKALPKKR
nr:MAG TPA: hypothetical protein [Caudoviricetes sp.]